MKCGRGRTAGLLSRVLVLAGTGLLATTGVASAARPTGPIAGWRQISHTVVDNAVSGEGITTVRAPGQEPALLYRAGQTIPQALKDEGWGHVGDPDSRRGYVYDAYQNTRDIPAPNKMYQVTSPTGQTTEYLHTLTPEEPAANANAQVAVTPDGRWLTSGALGQLDRLFVFPTPGENPRAPRAGGELPLSGRILLDHPIRNAQGCDFVTETRLLCATSDPDNDLYATNFQLLQIDLTHAVRAGDTRARVKSLGQVPLVSTCPGLFVTEGVDYDVPTATLRVEVVPPSPCNTGTDVYAFRRG
ncbi:hypothetical protein [Amycolatopsis sp. H20-H5]|uniref:hypothetical protein n=1 Tax=Amycolatopsis sp. H20-H5 TaxID=3046309 RepID=UPI002DBF4FF2|nr:hypothetical protein [Amycolatopsis sp. H20-H5]MEC3981763.1 hypothetical protein [Amycolatopsis sp. H20-H5]